MRPRVRLRFGEHQSPDPAVPMAREYDELRNERVLLRSFADILGTGSCPHAGVSNHRAIVVCYKDFSAESFAVSKHLFDVLIHDTGTCGHSWVEVALEVLERDRAAAKSVEIVLAVAFANQHAVISSRGSRSRRAAPACSIFVD